MIATEASEGSLSDRGSKGTEASSGGSMVEALIRWGGAKVGWSLTRTPSASP